MKFFISLFALSAIAGFLFLSVFQADATRHEVCFCHNVNHNPVTICTSDQGQINGHTKHVKNGTDTNGSCALPTLEPTEEPKPTEGIEPTIEPTVTVEPTATPEATVTPEQSNTGQSTPPVFAGSSTEAPRCGSADITQAVANPHVYRKGEAAIVKWFPTAGNKAHIYYKQVDSADWQYSLTVDNTGYAEIHGLGTMDITFAVQEVNDCSGGVTAGAVSMPIVDGNTSGWVLYR